MRENDTREEAYRLPLSYMASLFGAGNEGVVRYALRKQLAVRILRRQQTVGDIEPSLVREILAEADCTEEQALAIHHLSAMAPFDERFVIPPMHREEAMEMLGDEPLAEKGQTGVGLRQRPQRGA